MDSNRIIINNIDQSTAVQSNTTTVKGFTVVKAPKGPLKPVLISQQKDLKNIFGVSSREYPELFEVEQYIKSYSAYVSAPYVEGVNTAPEEDADTTDPVYRPRHSRIPVAYVTADGIFQGAYQVPYTAAVEAIVNGDTSYLYEDNVYVDGITRAPHQTGKGAAAAAVLEEGSEETLSPEAPSETPATWNSVVLKDINYPVSTNITPDAKDTPGVKAVKGVIYDNTYDGKSSVTGTPAILIPTTIKANQLQTIKNFRLANLPYEDKHGSNYMDFDVTQGDVVVELSYVEDGNEPSLLVGYLVIKKSLEEAPNTTWYSKITNGEFADCEDVAYLAITGAASISIKENPNCLVSTTDIDDLGTTKHVSNLQTFVRATLDSTKFYASIFPKYPSNRDIRLSFDGFDPDNDYTPTTADGRNIIRATVSEVSEDIVASATVVGSLDESYVTPKNTYIGFNQLNESYKDQSIISIVPFKTIFNSKNIRDAYKGIAYYPPIMFDRGYRDTDSNLLHETGWSYTKEHASDYSDVDVFFDTRRHHYGESLFNSDTFFTMGNDFKQSGFIYNLTVAPKEISSVVNKLEPGAQYWNLCNEATVKFGAGAGIEFMSPMTGIRAALQSRIIDKKAGGVAPMFLNDGDGLGGQMNVSGLIITPRYTYTKDQLTELDRKNFNPFIKDSNYNIMITGQKTGKPGATTDWSYIGHVSAFLNFQKEVKNTVMIPQLGKANNDYYRTLRRMDVERLLSRRLNGSSRIWAQAIVDTSTAEGVNDAAARRARKFVIDVKVKVDVFSEYVELNFTNVDQSVQLS